ncbi:MAG: GNAT family N-acetyltransferase [Anaerolineales bacterium]|nr:GNAT family N-acetyltransferase [Anaerolineales bacterium]
MSDLFTLRPATATDAPTIQALIRQAGINPTGLKWARFVLAIRADGEIVGCGQIKPHLDGSHELASLAVVPAWQGHGIARMLIAHLLTTHVGELYLMCRASLGPFYEKFGFQKLADSHMPPYFRRIKTLTKLAEFVMQEGELLWVMHRPSTNNT